VKTISSTIRDADTTERYQIEINESVAKSFRRLAGNLSPSSNRIDRQINCSTVRVPADRLSRDRFSFCGTTTTSTSAGNVSATSCRTTRLSYAVPFNLKRSEPDFNAPRKSAAISRPSALLRYKRTYEILFAQRVCLS